MKYRVWVSIGDDMEGEYDGVSYETKAEAERVRRVAEQEPCVISTWIKEVEE